jgi:hypothetical protein
MSIRARRVSDADCSISITRGVWSLESSTRTQPGAVGSPDITRRKYPAKAAGRQPYGGRERTRSHLTPAPALLRPDLYGDVARASAVDAWMGGALGQHACCCLAAHAVAHPEEFSRRLKSPATRPSTGDYANVSYAPGEIRTPDLRFRRPTQRVRSFAAGPSLPC